MQGGESTSAFFLFDELAKRQHTITVLTNHNDVRSNNRCLFTKDDSVRLRQNHNLTIATVVGDPVPDFIPQYDPKTEKLLNMGMQLIRQQKFDLIYGWYFLPYASAAYLLSEIFTIPFVLQHAGSDFTQLYPNKDLRHYIDTVIRASAGVLTYPKTKEYFEERKQHTLLVQKRPPPDIYSPVGHRADFMAEFDIRCDLASTFLCLGKFSVAKGFYQLIEAFRSIENATLLILCPNKKAVGVDLPKNVILLDCVSPWRIPAIIRSVKAVIVPEWNFNVDLHRSGVPIESLLCGRTAIVSNQIIGHYGWLRRFMVGIDTPSIDHVASTIKSVILDECINDAVTRHHAEIRSALGTFSEYVDQVEKFLALSVALKNDGPSPPEL